MRTVFDKNLEIVFQFVLTILAETVYSFCHIDSSKLFREYALNNNCMTKNM